MASAKDGDGQAKPAHHSRREPGEASLNIP